MFFPKHDLCPAPNCTSENSALGSPEIFIASSDEARKGKIDGLADRKKHD